MTPQLWRPDPQFKLDILLGVGLITTTYTNDEALAIEIVRPENNISYASITMNNNQSKNYPDVVKGYSQFDISLRYGSGDWTKIFAGNAYDVKPVKTQAGDLLVAPCWGLELGLQKTHCNTSYGTESRRNPTLNTPQEIIQDILANYADEALNTGTNSQYLFDYSKVDNIHSDLSITYFDSPYMDCLSAINRVLAIVNAHALAGSDIGAHWFVDPDWDFYCKEIDANHTDTSWNRYWKTTEAERTLTVNEDMIIQDFHQTMKNYTNDVILSTAFRLPAEDRWTEYDGVGAGGSALWGKDANVHAHDDNALEVVGTYCLNLHTIDNASGTVYYPSGKNAGWDLTKFCSPKTVGALNFWARRDGSLSASVIRLYTDADSFVGPYSTFDGLVADTNKWTFISLPVGTWHESQISSYEKRWYTTGSGDPGGFSWSNINWIEINFGMNCANINLYLDDLHWSGGIIRRAYDSTYFTDYRDQQKFIRNDTAVSDSLGSAVVANIANGSAGTAAMLTYDELQRGLTIPTVGVVEVPAILDILPGQTIHVHGCKTIQGDYHVDANFRVTEIRYRINASEGFRTTLSLTSDLSNSLAIGVPSMVDVLQEYTGAMGMANAQNLRGSGVDNLLTILSTDY